MGNSLAIGAFAIALTSIGAFRTNPPSAWSAAKAAAYLDTRTISWTHGGAMDHGTFCVSCHTGLPFALARPALQAALGQRTPGTAEARLLASVRTRVGVWNQVQPYLGDKSGGFGAESVFNALVLSRHDRETGHLSALTRQAFDHMWALQLTQGDAVGAWSWVNAGNEPWEAYDSAYWGAALAAVAVAEAPDGYLAEPGIQANVRALETYLRRPDRSRSTFNQLALLWAASKLPKLLDRSVRADLRAAILARQLGDGGWTTSTLIPATWKRRDNSPPNRSSDGYATGLAAYVLMQDGMARSSPPIRRALTWLASHQDAETGAWPTQSPNVTRDPTTDVGHFMTDAATAYAALALSSSR